MMVEAVGSSRPRMLGTLLLIMTFLVGALAGAAFQRVLGAGEPDQRSSMTAHERAGASHADLFERIGVSSDQRADIDRILERRREELDAFWEEAGPRLRAITDETRSEIKAILTPEQRDEMNRLRAERKARKHSHHERKKP